MSPGVPRPQVFRLLCNHLPGLAWRGASNKHGKGDEASSLWLGYKGSGFSLAHPSLPFSPLLTLMDPAAVLGAAPWNSPHGIEDLWAANSHVGEPGRGPSPGRPLGYRLQSCEGP